MSNPLHTIRVLFRAHRRALHRRLVARFTRKLQRQTLIGHKPLDYFHIATTNKIERR